MAIVDELPICTPEYVQLLENSLLLDLADPSDDAASRLNIVVHLVSLLLDDSMSRFFFFFFIR